MLFMESIHLAWLFYYTLKTFFFHLFHCVIFRVCTFLGLRERERERERERAFVCIPFCERRVYSARAFLRVFLDCKLIVLGVTRKCTVKDKGISSKVDH